VLIHGHTHRPAVHELTCNAAARAQRIVLSDWDLEAAAPRAEVLRLASDGAWQRRPPD
jgi:UDP-2,3-diacylglucosamine hydrolase